MSHDSDNSMHDTRGLAKGRTEALSDGIFAVAMTLIVLDIKNFAHVPIASMAVSFVSPRAGMYLYLLPAIPTFVLHGPDRQLNPGAAARADSTREDS